MPKIGPTGEFPFGEPINEKDRGGIFVGLHVRRAARQIILNFNTTTDWLAMPRSETIATIEEFRKIVTKNFGHLPYDASTLPIKVTVNHTKGIVESRLPIATSVLVANPEMFLGWADHLEAAARHCQPRSQTEIIKFD